MLDINLIRENPKIVRDDLLKRGDEVKLKWLDELIDIDKKARELKKEADDKRARRNSISKEISEAKKKGTETKKILEDAAKIPKEIEKIEKDLEEISKRTDFILMRLPNILHESVPVGKDDTQNKEISQFGKKPKYDFDPKSHVDILEELGMVDLTNAAKISGARFWFLKADIALLEFAIEKYAVDFMTARGYDLVMPPFMMNRTAYEGVTDLSDFENVMYKIEGEDLYLIATSEHPLTAMFQNDIIEKLPIKFAGISTNFRKEAGAHGKDQKGIFRGHQFNKIEQIIICKPEDSWKFHEELLKNSVEFFESLGMHGRIVNICTGDIGTVAAKKYDIEVWFSVQKAYREVVSCSNCTDYQARRLNIRYNTPHGNKPVHTLNSTCVATSRALVAIIENFQNVDGSINVPKALVPYMNGKIKISKA